MCVAHALATTVQALGRAIREAAGRPGWLRIIRARPHELTCSWFLERGGWSVEVRNERYARLDEERRQSPKRAMQARYCPVLRDTASGFPSE